MKTLAYVDGTNLLTELGKQCNLDCRPEKPPDAVLELAGWLLHHVFRFETVPYRFYWFGSYRGSEEDEIRIKTTLRKQAVEATLFRRREQREKGVDICLTKEMLVNAFHHNCECSVLFAGDEDYVSLVTEVKRYGQRVEGRFLQSPTSEHLILALDNFIALDRTLASHEGKDAIKRCQAALTPK